MSFLLGALPLGLLTQEGGCGLANSRCHLQACALEWWLWDGSEEKGNWEAAGLLKLLVTSGCISRGIKIFLTKEGKYIHAKPDLEAWEDSQCGRPSI